MSSVTLSGSCKRIAAKSPILPLLYPSLLNSRSASLNSAIGRGLRKSKGVGFRGREKSQYGGSDGVREPRNDSTEVRRTSETAGGSRGFSRDDWRGDSKPSGGGGRAEKPRTGRDVRIRAGKREVKDDRIPVRRSRAARFYDPDSSFGKRSAVGREKKGLDAPAEPEAKQDWRGFAKKVFSDSKKDGFKEDRIKDSRDTPRGSWGREQWKTSSAQESSPARSSFRSNSDDKSFSPRKQFGTDRGSGGREQSKPSSAQESSPARSSFRSNSDDKSFAPRKQFGTDRGSFAPAARLSQDKDFSFSSKKGFETDRRRPTLAARSSQSPESSGTEAVPQKTKPAPSIMDKRMPVTIPYTTPASEFLYGTSVVEAALNSRASPRRTLYKFYIYRGANRESEEQDRTLAKLARKQDVPVEYVTEDWLRRMDKMSAGRPHNGYILEASPLPKLPVLSLGEVTVTDEKQGFKLVLGHQSREEAAVNGTSDFVHVNSLSRSGDGRKPFVLLLDSILDPGNLGGIIRTAAFLGVTAIAISSRNSAGFSPVVLKASAGACENVRLFTVDTPAGFVADSKAAGWKIYAAVAPSTNRSANAPLALTTDELCNPLEEAPSILMLGSEGAGLRWNLRSKADVELSIEGSGQRGLVDSMNVSVATGVLCNAFVSKKKAQTAPPPRLEAEKKPVKDLF
ncbi:hypothetical protein V493_04197 [Pseudogymnoascus sp. VKM F-4281 (FW-2241)]|nr:hypothetical protein V493_04197 [Pseudogymnoascus sp. VKM F-4281 (FW-2241)]